MNNNPYLDNVKQINGARVWENPLTTIKYQIPEPKIEIYIKQRNYFKILCKSIYIQPLLLFQFRKSSTSKTFCHILNVSAQSISFAF